MMTPAAADIVFSRRNRVPAITAAETAECGLACLAMIACHHGHDVDLNSLRQRFSIALTGVTLRGLMAMADELGFSTRPLRVEIESLDRLVLPAILHWDLDHFVVLVKIGRGGITIHDPAAGARTLSRTETSKHFTGVALELRPAETFSPLRLRQPMRISQLWSSISGLTGTLVQIFALSIAVQIAAFAAPFQLQLVVDDAIYQSDHDLLTVIALGFGGLVVLQTALQFLRDRVVLIAGNLFGYQVVGNLLHHLMRLSSDFFEKRHLGDILSRMRSSEPIRNAITQGVIGTIVDGAMAMIAVVILFAYSAVLACIVLGSVALYLGLMLATYPVMRERTREQITASAKEQTNLMENVRAAITIKLMGREAEREGIWRNLYANVVNTSLSLGTLQISTGAAQNVLFGLQTVLVIYVGGGMAIDGAGFSIGMLVAFLALRQTFSDRMASLINQAMQFRLLGLHLERLGDIAHAVSDLEEPIPPIEISGRIEAVNISFRYGSSDPFIIRDCSLCVPDGAFVAITGASGGGKSTLLKLLLGLYPPASGEIMLDGRVAAPRLWRAWRSHVGMVAQDDRLLSGTVADNIAFFDPDLSMEHVLAAASAARVHEEILRMPMQYLSRVGDMGSSLSAGQRQRVLLARALYRNPKVLILDEGTANLDEATECEIADLVASMRITRIVVAHRPALVRLAETVYVLKAGRLAKPA